MWTDLYIGRVWINICSSEERKLISVFLPWKVSASLMSLSVTVPTWLDRTVNFTIFDLYVFKASLIASKEPSTSPVWQGLKKSQQLCTHIQIWPQQLHSQLLKKRPQIDCYDVYIVYLHLRQFIWWYGKL